MLNTETSWISSRFWRMLNVLTTCCRAYSNGHTMPIAVVTVKLGRQAVVLVTKRSYTGKLHKGRISACPNSYVPWWHCHCQQGAHWYLPCVIQDPFALRKYVVMTKGQVAVRATLKLQPIYVHWNMYIMVSSEYRAPLSSPFWLLYWLGMDSIHRHEQSR